MAGKIRRLDIVFIVLLFGCLARSAVDVQPVYAQASKWSAPLNISKTNSKSWLPAACADRFGNVHVVWGEFVDPASTWSDTLYYTMWDGRQWSKPNAIAVSGISSDSAVSYSAIAADDQGWLHLVWTDRHSIYYSQAFIGDQPWLAKSWSSPKIIFPNPGAEGNFPSIAIDSKQAIHVVFNTATQSYHIGSSDGGRTWSPPVGIAETPNVPTRPQITSDSRGLLHVGITEVSKDADNGIGVLYARSLDGGTTWDVTRRLSEGTSGQYPVMLSTGVDGKGVVHAVWAAATSGVFYHRTSSNRGATWSDAKIIARGSVGHGWPSMAVDGGGTLHLLLSVNTEINHYQWTGTEWTAPENISQTTTSSNMPILAVTGGNQLHAIWMEYVAGQLGVHDSGNMETYYSTTTIQAPAVPLAMLPPRLATATPIVTPTPTRAVQPTIRATSTPSFVSAEPSADVQPNQAFPLLAGILPIGLLLGLILAARIWTRR